MKVINLKNINQSKLETLNKFRVNLCEKIGIKSSDWNDYFFEKRLSVNCNNKIFSTSGESFQMEYRTQKFRLGLIPMNNDSIEIWWIEVFNKGTGLGSEIINNILDVSDQLGIGVKVIPVDFDNQEGKIENLYRLRDWYRSFGFESRNSNRTPELYYNPQVQTLKMAS